MQDTFVVSVGRIMFFWRALMIDDSSGLWYRCHIQSVSAMPMGDDWEVGAVIRYEDGLCQDVIFSIENGEQIATCPHSGRQLLWTLASGEQLLSLRRREVRQTVPAHPAREGNEGFMLEQRSMNRSGDQNLQEQRETETEQQNVKLLEMRLELLEKRFEDLNRELKTRDSTMEVPSQIVTNQERVLQQLRGKMEMVLDRPLQNGLHNEERKLCIRNEVIRCSVDCSLAEYRELCLGIKKDFFVSSTFDPDGSSEQSTVFVFSTTRIHFLSFGDMCAALGESDYEKLVSCIIKSRRRKTRSSPAMIRIIGNALIPVPESTDPLYITVGSCISRRTVHLCKRLVPAIRRESMLQDEIDMSYVHELETLMLDKTQIELISDQRMSGETLNDVEHKRSGRFSSAMKDETGFQMRWAPQRAPVCPNLFEDRTRILQRAGYLELLLPTVMCYNTSQCEELVSVCKKEFLSAGTQRMSSLE